ncbi:L,D-transpeptidase family protein [Shimia aestuarii]|uniref:L,D-transpeptidase catalytic domain n=1 Tax=Shimia aestuarii TaxID=254406 RepID=A0A1I4KKZ9_9RHOB|nr:L,D-transpeptidase family protein [Shimia aestuarii]SFL79107.1 L,D-transpeptidase catalytic domain [Shimia aestuarii]
MRWISILLVALMAFGLASCSKFKTYNGPEVTRVLIYKEERKMYLMHHDKALKSYDIGLGFAPVGHKQIEGDGRTPEGDYFVNRRNPNSEFYLSIGISYPNAADRAYARSIGKSPGGDIFIHGRPSKYQNGKDDWTAGCVAVTNAEMRDVYAMVRNGTRVSIFP